MNKIIKLKIFQEKAVFRTPYSMEIIETYPLPPYSTILGFIHNMLSAKKTIDDINISVQGKYGNINREFIRYHKYVKNESDGKPYPIIVTSLIDLELIIHIKMPTLELHNNLLASFSNPPYFPYLGRPEDLITKFEFREDEEIDRDLSKTKKGGIIIPYNCYIRFDLAKNLQIEGITYLIPSYYKLTLKDDKTKSKATEIFRNFEMIKVIYSQFGQTVIGRIFVDKDNSPIWWMK